MDFYSKNQNLKQEIKKRVIMELGRIEDPDIKKILLQRQATSSYIKGISSYYIINGLTNQLSRRENLELSANIELWSTGLVILDNITDNHFQRNGKTTYLQEFGIQKNAVASSYATHLGMLGLAEYIGTLKNLTKDLGKLSTSNSVDGAINMDINKPKSSKEILDSIAKVNGITLALPLSISVAAGKPEKNITYNILKYGYDTGLAFGLFEELRDLIGEHGREKASEIKGGRTPYFLARAKEIDPVFDPEIFVGKKLSEEEYQEMLAILRNTHSLEHTANIILNHLEYGRKRIEWSLDKENYLELDLLRKTTESNLERILQTIKSS